MLKFMNHKKNKINYLNGTQKGIRKHGLQKI